MDNNKTSRKEYDTARYKNSPAANAAKTRKLQRYAAQVAAGVAVEDLVLGCDKKARTEYNATKYDVAAPAIAANNAAKYAAKTKLREEEWRADQLALAIRFSGGRGVIAGTSHSTPRTASSRSPPDLFALTTASMTANR